jgi:acetyl esterase/lipase
VELNTRALKKQLMAAFKMDDIKQARRYLDSLTFSSGALNKVTRIPVETAAYKGAWFVPKDAETGVTLLYLHGGGYTFYPKAYANLIALIALAAKCRTFVLDYWRWRAILPGEIWHLRCSSRLAIASFHWPRWRHCSLRLPISTLR